MNKTAFEKIVKEHGKDILRFCRMTTGSREEGDELYQDTMLALFEKADSLDGNQNVKGYAISISLLLWKNKKRKYARRNRITGSMQSVEKLREENSDIEDRNSLPLEQMVIKEQEKTKVRTAVKNLPEKYSMIIHMYYSAQMSIPEISEALHIPQGTVKTRMHKARQILKKELEA